MIAMSECSWKNYLPLRQAIISPAHDAAFP
jgi:hypothetical protein